jgi:hypothetical protein
MANICTYIYDPNILTQRKVNAEFALLHKHVCYLEAVATGILSVSTSSTSSTTLSTSNDLYVFSGTTATWTLPPLSGNTGKFFFIKNRGTGNVTLQAAGSDSLYKSAVVSSITILPGEAYIIANDGVYWDVM